MAEILFSFDVCVCACVCDVCLCASDWSVRPYFKTVKATDFKFDVRVSMDSPDNTP